MSITHTVGPWKVDTDIDDDGRKVFVVWADGSVIAQVDKLSDAHLIAATPELLAQLHEIEIWLRAGVPDLSAQTLRDIHADVVAAIAKAEGQQS